MYIYNYKPDLLVPLLGENDKTLNFIVDKIIIKRHVPHEIRPNPMYKTKNGQLVHEIV